MRIHTLRQRARNWIVTVTVCLVTIPRGAGAADDIRSGWNGSWACAPQLAEPANRPPPPGLSDATLRQIVHLTQGGTKIRIRFSNEFGNEPLTLSSVHVAHQREGAMIDPASDREVTFHHAASVTIQTGALMFSDPIDFDVGADTNLVVSIYLKAAPSDFTSHPGSRMTSYLQPGNLVTAPDLAAAQRVEHWYFVSGVDVWTDHPGGAVVVLGDSITDGRGSTTDANDRWPDQLARRLQRNAATKGVAVLNQGIGGNRVLRNGLGPNALARFDRDVIAQTGARWLIVFEGINDLGTAAGARAKGQPAATAEDLIAAYEQFIVRAHAHDIRVFGATITPYQGADFYFSAQGEADRQTINEWIRKSGKFDAVIDFDATVRDPKKPTCLDARFDCGDHLHLSPRGYQAMADAIDLELFSRKP